MLFPTFDFLLFILPVLAVAWALSHRPVARVLFLLGASYFFYVGGPKTPPQPPWYFVGLLVFSTLLDYVVAHHIHRASKLLDDPDATKVKAAKTLRNLLLTASLVGNLGLLAYFKYTNFFLEAFGDVARSMGMEVVVPHLELVLPVGISFYTFQSLSYTIDVWRQRLTPEPSLRKFALFVVFFPQLVAGPIVRASEFLPQLHRRFALDPKRMEEGMFRIFKGLVKKVILGDWIAGQFADAVFDTPGAYTSAEVMLALYAFTLQLYADFSGYSDIAIGVARLLGFKIPENFDRPHQAKNLGEFWRRWHMTLSTWLRDYLFFPLGGSRRGTGRTYFNLWTTMFLVGMWHGASWNFVIYSNLHAFAMLFNRWNRTRSRSRPWLASASISVAMAVVLFAAITALSGSVLELPTGSAIGLGAFAAICFLVVTAIPDTGTALNTAVHVFLTFHFTVLSRVFFRASDLDASREMIARLVALDSNWIRPGFLTPWVWLALILGTAYHFTPKHWVDDIAFAGFRKIPGPVLGLAMGGLGAGLMYLLSGTPRAFIYFSF